MSRLLLILAIGPTFALLLGLAGLSTRRLLMGGPGPVVRVAPVLYTLVVLAAAVTAGMMTGFNPVQLGLHYEPFVAPAQLAGGPGWVLVAATCCALVAGLAGYFAELFLSHRAVQRAMVAAGAAPREPGGPATQPAGMRSVASWASAPRVMVSLGVVTAVSEEILFRGFLLTGLRAQLGLAAALAIQAVIFGTHHVSFGLRAVLAKAGHGVVWGLLAVVAGSIVPALTAHLVFQLLACRRVIRTSSRARPHEDREGGAFDDSPYGSAALRRPPLVG